MRRHTEFALAQCLCVRCHDWSYSGMHKCQGCLGYTCQVVWYYNSCTQVAIEARTQCVKNGNLSINDYVLKVKACRVQASFFAAGNQSGGFLHVHQTGHCSRMHQILNTLYPLGIHLGLNFRGQTGPIFFHLSLARDFPKWQDLQVGVPKPLIIVIH